MILTKEQRNHFEVFGFLKISGWLSPVDFDRLSHVFDETMLEARGGKPFDGDRSQQRLSFVEYDPWLRGLIQEDRAYGLVEELLGHGFVWNGSAANLFVGATGWHPDQSDPSYRTVKVAFYLDPVDVSSGCLRVIPGSHTQPLHEWLTPLWNYKADPTSRPFGASAEQVPCHFIESEPGDMILFSRNIWHATYGGFAGRRQIQMGWVASPNTDAHIEHIKRNYKNKSTAILRSRDQQPPTLFGKDFLHSRDTRLHSMTSKLVELGFS